MDKQEAIALLGDHACEVMDAAIAKFPEGKERSAVLAALREVQHENGGYLTTELMDAVAAYIGLPRTIASLAVTRRGSASSGSAPIPLRWPSRSRMRDCAAAAARVSPPG